MNKSRKTVSHPVSVLLMETIHPDSSENMGGGNTHKLEIATNLLAHSVDVHFFSDDDWPDQADMTPHRHPAFRKGFLSTIGYFFRSLKIARSHRCTVLYARHYTKALSGLAIKYLLRIPLVYEANGILPEEIALIKEREQNRLSVSDRFVCWLDRFIGRKSDAIISVSPGIKSYYVDSGVPESRITVISNGANTEIFHPIQDEELLAEQRTRLGILSDAPVAIFVGSIQRWQGVRDIIETAPRIIEAVPDVIFLFVGSGELSDEMTETLAQRGLLKHFVFAGRKPYNEVPIYTSMAQVCIYPLMEKGCSPLKLAEYGACERPVVVTAIADLKEYLEIVEPGIGVTPGDLDEFADAVITLLKDRKRCMSIGKNARSVIVKEYSWKRAGEKTAQVLREVTRDHRSVDRKTRSQHTIQWRIEMRKLAVKAYDTYEHSFHRTPHAVDRMLFSMKNVSALLKSFIGFPRTKLLWLARTGLLRSKTVCRIYRLCGVKIGPLSTIAPQGVYLDVEGLRHISIGRDVHISPYVSIITHAQTPPFHAPRFGRAGLKKLDRWKPRPVIIGDGAVIYTGATILPGVTVGEGAMIGAGAVVNRDVEPFTMVGGIPAKPIGSTRESTPQKIIDGIEITPFKYGLPGALCLSADFELNWAVRDRFGNTGHMTRRFLPGLLEFFEKYQTPVTWATVGHLFLDHCERPSGAAQPHADIPMKQDDWFSVDPCSNVEKEPSWYGPDLIRMIMDSSIKSPAISSAKPPAISSDKSSVKSSVMHEIGCHTFSHVDLSDEDCPSPYAPKDCSPEVANAELAKCVAVMEPFGVRPRSLVFPKNYEGNYESLVRNGFTCFRSRNVEGILHYPRKVHDLWDLPASNDFSPLLLVRNADDIDYRLRRYIDEAIACNKCAHFWFHPWFMSEKVLGLLAPTFEYIRELQDKKQLWVATMEEIAAYCEARETVDLSISSTGDAISSTGNAGSSTGNALSVQITHTIDTERYGTPSLTLRIPAELLPDSQYELTAQPSMEDVSWEERESSLFVTLSVTVQRLTITSKT